MAVRCGNHETTTYHESVAEIRQCFAGESVKTSVTNHDLWTGPALEPTKPQLKYINDLLRQKSAEYVPGVDTIVRSAVSGILSDLKSGSWTESADYRRIETAVTKDLPKSNGSAFDPETLDDGFYVRDGEVYKVIVAVHGSGRKYAKKLDLEVGKWQFDRGAIHKLRPEHWMTLEQALEVAKVSRNVNSALYGACFICGRTLTDETSIDRGIGPICYGKMGG